MQNRLPSPSGRAALEALNRPRRPLNHLICIVWVGCLGTVLGPTVKMIICHKLPTNVYLCGLRIFKILSIFLDAELTDLEALKGDVSRNSLIASQIVWV